MTRYVCSLLTSDNTNRRVRAVSWEEYRKHRCNFDWVTAHEGEIDWKEVRKRESAEELKHALRELAAKLGIAVLILSYTALFVLTTVLVFHIPRHRRFPASAPAVRGGAGVLCLAVLRGAAEAAAPGPQAPAKSPKLFLGVWP